MSWTERGRDGAPPERPETPPRADRAESTGRAGRGLAAVGAWARTPAAVTALGIAVVGALFFWGGWQRRWIADDGLIVLRTVRNLIAGNGPVFNAGERVEVNTSAAWTYVVWLPSWITGARIEYVVLAITLIFSVAAVALVMLGAGRLHRHRRRFTGPDAPGSVLLLPAGVLVYIALPPARDYATSGLETSMVIFWLGLVFWLLMRWATTPAPGRAQVFTLGFFAGLSWLVRPETVLLGLAVLIVLFFARQSWRRRIWLVVISGAVPVGYQIWRMGYYGLPYPNTAVAKDATEAKWGAGWHYLTDLFDPYLLWLPLVLLVVAGAVPLLAWLTAARTRTASGDRPAVYRAAGARTAAGYWHRVQDFAHSPTGAVTVVLAVAVVWLIYEIRVGGDFMHGRVLLPVVFLFIAPLAVLPLPLPARADRSAPGTDRAGAPDAGARRRSYAVTGAVAALWVGICGWAIGIAGAGTDLRPGVVPRDGIVDERAFYILMTGHAHPITAEHYLDYPRIRAMDDALRRSPEGGLLTSSGLDNWTVVPGDRDGRHTVYFLNLGMPSMNTDLDTRIYDPMGLAYPLAAHTERIEGGRIGHDKNLPVDWVIADLQLVDRHADGLPGWIDEDWVDQARVALTCEQTQDLYASFTGELTTRRFLSNIRHAFDRAGHQIDAIPRFEIARCGLEMPEPVSSGG